MSDTTTEQGARESGQAGGGQGRIDETGLSGVYPGDGPWPKGDAPFVSPAAWGQGERGAEGYNDHGDSEMSYIEEIQQAGGDRSGGASAPPANPSQAGPIEAAVEIPYHEWEGFFNDLSERHGGQVVRVEIGTAEPGWPIDSVTRRLADGLPLGGIVAEFRDEAPGSIEIILGTDPEAQITHTVTQPTHVWYAQDTSENDRAVLIQSADSPSALIRF